MTRYEQGFLTKCAEYGIDGRELLYKQAGIGSALKKVLSKIKRFYTYPGKIRHNISKAIEGGISSLRSDRVFRRLAENARTDNRSPA